MDQETRAWACHLAALASFLGIPLGSILGPLVVWLIKKNDHPFIDNQGRESLNFQISMGIYAFLSLISIVFTVGLSAILVFIILLTRFVLVIVAAIRANNGEYYCYPFTIRFIQ